LKRFLVCEAAIGWNGCWPVGCIPCGIFGFITLMVTEMNGFFNRGMSKDKDRDWFWLVFCQES
jgi:hypothetical protein